MITRSLRALTVCAGACAALLFGGGAASAQSYAQFNVPLPMITRGVIPLVQGKMGGIAVDLKSGRQYFAALRNGTLEVLDASGLKVVQTIRDLNEPTTPVFVQDPRMLLLTCGDGKLIVYGADAAGELKQDRVVELGGEARQVRFSEGEKRAWVTHARAVTAVDPVTGTKGKSIEFGASTEGIALEVAGNRAFVNIPSKGQVAVIDREKNEVVATWDLKDVKGNYQLALDEVSKRLFVSCRNPAKLLVLDTTDGKEIARLPIGEDADSTWYDAPGKRIYVSCGGGAGEVTMILQESADKYKVEHNVQTNTGARTSVLVSQKRRFIVAAPSLGDSPTFVYIYIIPP